MPLAMQMEHLENSLNFIRYEDVTDKAELEAIQKILRGHRITGKIELPWLPKPPDAEPVEYVEHEDNLSFAEIDDVEELQEQDLHKNTSVKNESSTTTDDAINAETSDLTSTPLIKSYGKPTEQAISPKPAAAPKSWSALFSSNNQANTPSTTEKLKSPNATSSSRSNRNSAEVKTDKPIIDSQTKEFIDGQKPKMADITYQIRGMTNGGNWCYITSILQAMLACPPMHHFLRSLTQIVDTHTKTQSTKSVLTALVWLAHQCSNNPHNMQTESSSHIASSYRFQSGDSLDPSIVYDILPKLHRSTEGLFTQGLQEDAEEFLTSLLNTLHEEISCTDITKLNTPDKFPALNGKVQDMSEEADGADNDEDDNNARGWQQVGRKNRRPLRKLVVLGELRSNQSPAGHSAISRMFQGILCSSLYTAKESSTLEPFFTIPINVQNTKGKHSVEEALQSFIATEKIEGFKLDDGRKTKVWRQLRFEELPPIMIIHLKCFVYEESGPQKVLHDTRFSTNLIIQKDWMSDLVHQKYKNEASRSYQLFAVVYHTGTKASGGHYTSSVRYKPFGHGKSAHCWIHLDDLIAKPVPENSVLYPERPTVPYLLFYIKR